MAQELVRVAFLCLVGWGLFVSIRKALRLTGVVPYPPFKSRSEYLEAALEMNLEEFIERAKVTPREVTQKLPAPKFRMATPEEAHLVGGVMPRPNPIAEQVDPKVGKWFRTKGRGCLIRYSGPSGFIGWSVYETPVHCHLKDADLEPAYPKSGEWWEKLRCAQTHLAPGISFVAGVQKWGRNDLEAAEAVKCGCLVPINFGKGEERKSYGGGAGGGPGWCGIAGAPEWSGAGGAGGGPGLSAVGMGGIYGASEAIATINNLINKSSRGLEEVVALKNIDTTKLFPRQPGKWCRLKKTGELIQSCECKEKTCDYYVSLTNYPTRHELTEIEPAYPRKGEWWQQTARNPDGRYFLRADYQTFWTEDMQDLKNQQDLEKYRKAVDEGYLVPICFGKGFKNQA